MAQRAVEASWDLLGGDASLFFGRECLSVTVWMLVCLLARSLLVWMRMQTMVSFGLVSHLPIVFMTVQQYLKVTTPVPLLTFRLAEIIIGRLSPHKVTSLIPAHFLGCIIGTLIFNAVFFHTPLFDASGMGVLPSSTEQWVGVRRTLADVAVVFAYTVLLHALPQLIHINRLPRILVNVVAFPLLAVSLTDAGNTFNPATLYALRFVDSQESFSLSHFVQHGHLMGPVVGALLAGVVCAKYFPDNAKLWVSSKKTKKAR